MIDKKYFYIWLNKSLKVQNLKIPLCFVSIRLILSNVMKH